MIIIRIILKNDVPIYVWNSETSCASPCSTQKAAEPISRSLNHRATDGPALLNKRLHAESPTDDIPANRHLTLHFEPSAALIRQRIISAPVRIDEPSGRERAPQQCMQLEYSSTEGLHTAAAAAALLCINGPTVTSVPAFRYFAVFGSRRAVTNPRERLSPECGRESVFGGTLLTVSALSLTRRAVGEKLCICQWITRRRPKTVSINWAQPLCALPYTRIILASLRVALSLARRARGSRMRCRVGSGELPRREGKFRAYKCAAKSMGLRMRLGESMRPIRQS